MRGMILLVVVVVVLVGGCIATVDACSDNCDRLRDLCRRPGRSRGMKLSVTEERAARWAIGALAYLAASGAIASAAYIGHRLVGLAT